MDSYLQVRKGAVLLVSKHATICCEVLNAQLVERRETASEGWMDVGPGQGEDTGPGHFCRASNILFRSRFDLGHEGVF